MKTARPARRRPRRSRDADATRQALLAAATATFADEGYAGARVDVIAERARVNKRMIYAYFGDKDGLYREVLASHLAVPPFARDPGAEPRAALIELIRWYFRLLADDPAFARLLAWGMLAGSAGRNAILLSSAGPALDLVASVVRRGIASGAFRADVSPEMLRTAMLSLCLGYFVQHDAMISARRGEARGWSDDEFLEAACRFLLDGLAARKGAG